MNNKQDEKQYSIIQKNHPYKKLWKYLSGKMIEIPTWRFNGIKVIEEIGLFI